MEETYQLPNNRTLKIVQDEFGESPRSWDNLAKMIFFGNYSHLGDKHTFKSEDYSNWDEMEEAIKKELDVACIKRIYGYSHSGLTIATTPFSCPWDSATLGFAVITKADLRENYSLKRLSVKAINEGYERIEGEIETLDQYVTGDVYGFQISKNVTCDSCDNTKDEHEDSCYGFYGSDLKESGILDHLSEEDVEFIEKSL